MHALRNKHRHTGENGTMIIGIAMILVITFFFVALSVDVGLAYFEGRRTQIATDAGAYAGAKLIGSAATESAIRFEARSIAIQNGVTDAEIDLGGGIELGRWDRNILLGSGTFTPGFLPYNAIRVRARRTTPTLFGRVFGQERFVQTKHSIVRVGQAGLATCLIPFGVEDDALAGKSYGDVLVANNASPGNWGKLDIGGNMSSGPNFYAAMINGVCSVTLRAGESQVSLGTGFAEVRDGFADRKVQNAKVTIPIVDGLNTANGNSTPVLIKGFLAAEIVSSTGNGSNWEVRLRIDRRVGGFGFAPATPLPVALTRVLVQ